MPSSDSPRVFISYAHRDGANLAQRLQQSLNEKGFDAWLDTERLHVGAIWSLAIEQEISARDVTIALLTPGSYESEICRAEQLRTLREGKRLIPVLAAKNADRPLYLEARQYRDFTDARSYDERLAQLLADIRGDVTAILPDAYRKTRITYLTAPPRVANYLERTEALKAVRNTLFAEDHRQPIALTALHGMGGIGKTVLAKALTDDEVVRQAFPDGIVWITAGKERKRDFIEEMREVAKALGDDLSGYDTALACENQYRTTVANKAALVVVDDVWSVADIKPLLAESPRSRFLFTTRDASIGKFVAAREHRADLLDVAQSRELLALWANNPFAELPATANDIIHECGRLPLALSVIGAMLRGAGPKVWKDTLDLLRNADLSAIQEQLPEGQDSFFKAVEVSFQSLKPEMQERYKALAVLLEDMAAPLSILETLWNVNEVEARRISRHFVDRSLAQLNSADESLRLHDLQVDYVRAQYPDKEALRLIHGAIRLALHVIGKDKDQFASQILGRLLAYRDMPAVEEFTKRVAEGVRTPWIRSLQPTLYPPVTAMIRTLEGHAGSVTGVAVTPDTHLAVSASEDHTLKVWDVVSGSELRTLQGHTDAVPGVALREDGRLAVSASADKTLKVWDLESGSELRTLQGHSDRVIGVAISADGRVVISASRDRALKVWDLVRGCELRTLTGHTGAVNAVAVTADGRRAVSASADKTLRVWDVENGRELRTLTGHTDAVNAVAVTADGRRAVSASDDKTLKVWDVDNGCELWNLAGHGGPVTSVAPSRDGRLMVSGSYDCRVKVWDLEAGSELRTLRGHFNLVFGVALSGDGRQAVSASMDNTLKVWDVGIGRQIRLQQGHSNYVVGLAVGADGRRAVSASYDRTLKVWDIESAQELRTLKGHANMVYGVAMSADGRRVVSASSDKTLKVWDGESGHELCTLKGHAGFVLGVALSGDGRRAVSASDDKTLKVWDVETGCTLHNLLCLVRRILRGRELLTLQGHSASVNGVAVTADGRRAVSASSDKTLKVWDVDNGHNLCTFEGHLNWVIGVAVSRDGRRAVSASADNTLKVWDLTRRRELRTLTGHSHYVLGVALSEDGRHAFSASRDNTLKVWDVELGHQIATFTFDSLVSCVVAHNHKIIVGDAIGHVHFLRLEEPKPKSKP